MRNPHEEISRTLCTLALNEGPSHSLFTVSLCLLLPICSVFPPFFFSYEGVIFASSSIYPWPSNFPKPEELLHLIIHFTFQMRDLIGAFLLSGQSPSLPVIYKLLIGCPPSSRQLCLEAVGVEIYGS